MAHPLKVVVRCKVMAHSKELQRRALHIMVDALADSTQILETALDDMACCFAPTDREQRQQLIGIALIQAGHEMENRSCGK